METVALLDSENVQFYLIFNKKSRARVGDYMINNYLIGFRSDTRGGGGMKKNETKPVICLRERVFYNDANFLINL